MAVADKDNSILLWNLAHIYSKPTIYKGNSDKILSLTFSNESKKLVAGRDKSIIIWEIENTELNPLILHGHNSPVLFTVFNKNGKLITGSVDNTIKIWDINGYVIETIDLVKHEKTVKTMTINNAFQFITSISKTNISIINLFNPKEDSVYLTIKDSTSISLLNPHGNLLAIAKDKDILLYDLLNINDEPIKLEGSRYKISSLKFSKDSRILASGSDFDDPIRLWNITNPFSQPILLEGLKFSARSPSYGSKYLFAFSPDGKIFASGSINNKLRLWDLSGPLAKSTIRDHGAPVLSIAFSPDGKTLISDASSSLVTKPNVYSSPVDTKIKLWDILNNSFNPIIFEGHKDSVVSIAFNPNGKTFASSSLDKSIRIWNYRNYNEDSVVLNLHKRKANSISYSKDGLKLASGNSDGTITVWDLQNKEFESIVLKGHSDGILSIAFSPDGSLLASGGYDNKLLIWDFTNLETKPTKLKGHEKNVLSLDFSSDGFLIASSNNYDKWSGEMSKIFLWNLEKLNEEPVILMGHTDSILSVAFSPDSSFLASGSRDNTIRLWDLRNVSSQPSILRGHEGPVTTVAFNTKYQEFASGSRDGTIRTWPTLNKLYESVCQKVYRNLTLEEWQEFIGLNFQYERTCNNLPIHPSFIQAGQNLAKQGDLNGAASIFKRILEIDGSTKIDPYTESKKIYSNFLLKESNKLIREGKIQKAISIFKKSQRIYPAQNKHSEILNSICWLGSLYGYAADVTEACESAVNLSEGNANIIDSRGLSRALSGNIKGAIEDFNAFINKTDNQEYKLQRQKWVKALNVGTNPFTEEEIKKLLD